MTAIGAFAGYCLYQNVQELLKSNGLRVRNADMILGNQINWILAVISFACLISIVIALVTSNAAMFKLVAVLTISCCIILLIPLAVIGLNYHPETWPIYVVSIIGMMLVTALLFLGAQHLERKNEFESSDD